MHTYDSGETFGKNTTCNKLEGIKMHKIKMHLVGQVSFEAKYWLEVDFYYLMYKVLQEKMSSVCKHN